MKITETCILEDRGIIYIEGSDSKEFLQIWAKARPKKRPKFLTEVGVFTDDQIDAYISLKMEEVHNFEHTPHPIEFEMYYSC